MTSEVRSALDSLIKDAKRRIAHVLKCNAKSGELEMSTSIDNITADSLPKIADDIPEGAPRLVM